MNRFVGRRVQLREDPMTVSLRQRLASAYDEELAVAADDLEHAPWSEGIPRPPITQRSGRTIMRGLHIRRRTAVLQLAVLVVVVALVSGAVLIPGALRSGPDRYDDGIPRTWQGQPVLRGQAALNYAKASADDAPFLVALWAGYPDLMNCNAQPQFDDPCEGTSDVGDEPGVPSDTLGPALHMQRARDMSRVTPGPLIVRVHTHDPQALTCTADRLASCQAVMVVDDILWTGDQATEPHPTTVGQVIAAFGVVSGLSSPGNMLGDLPGIPQELFPGPGPSFEGAAAVFPSPEALAAAFPDAAAHGESDSFPVNSWLEGITTGGSDPNRGPGIFTFKIHWLARGNVLVGVYYDITLGPNADPYVKMAREDLAKLPG
jgi:hypothetical protein